MDARGSGWRRRAAVLFSSGLLVLGTGARAAGVVPEAAGPPAGAAGVAGVPLEVATIGGVPRLVATVVIGGARLRVLVDTGSTGLRVVAGKIPRTAVTVLGDAAPYGYGSGTRLHGKRATADVMLGGFTARKAPVHLVTSTTCAARKPNCPAAGGRKPVMFGRALDGILGVSTADAVGLANPLWYLHNARHQPVGRQYAIHYDPEGQSRLLLGVPATGYRTVALPDKGDADDPSGPPSWDSRQMHACFASPDLTGGKVCGPTLLDTGTPGLRILDPGSTAGPVPDDVDIDLSVPTAGWKRTLTTGDDTHARVHGTQPSLAGLIAYVGTNVRYDLTSGTIGFAPFPVATTGTP
ncbi:DUF3443 family protein [Streptomyces sp. NPDC087440]|uniref:DUF3443 family protein n=1 Tax=Streptomyces sp. NPDC087440 TaxID=3365790 RepID=UPI00380117D3